MDGAILSMSAVKTVLSTRLDAKFSTSSGIPVSATSTCSSRTSSVFISYATRQSLMECHVILKEVFMEVSSISWRQAMFSGGALSHSAPCGLDIMGHGPGEMGWLYW
jgi:hypothetical protein